MPVDVVFRRGGKDRWVPSSGATGLCLLLVVGAVNGVVIVRELLMAS